MACLEKDFKPLREGVTALATPEVAPLGNSKQASQHSTPHLLPPSCPATGGLRTGAPLPHPGHHRVGGSILLSGEDVPFLPKTSRLCIPCVTQAFTELKKGPSYVIGPGEDISIPITLRGNGGRRGN